MTSEQRRITTGIAYMATISITCLIAGLIYPGARWYLAVAGALPGLRIGWLLADYLRPMSVTFTWEEWEVFRDAVKGGDFDDL
jgi:hypothetical protein